MLGRPLRTSALAGALLLAIVIALVMYQSRNRR